MVGDGWTHANEHHVRVKLSKWTVLSYDGPGTEIGTYFAVTPKDPERSHDVSPHDLVCCVEVM